MTEDDRRKIGHLVERARRSDFGTKSAAYSKAGINAATWDKIEAGEFVREDRLTAAVKLLWPDSNGDWHEVLHPPTGFGGRSTVYVSEVHDFESWATREIERLRDRVDVLEEKEQTNADSAAPNTDAGGTPAEEPTTPRVGRVRAKGKRLTPADSPRRLASTPDDQ